MLPGRCRKRCDNAVDPRVQRALGSDFVALAGTRLCRHNLRGDRRYFRGDLRWARIQTAPKHGYRSPRCFPPVGVFTCSCCLRPLLADHRGDRSVDSRLVARRETRRMVTFIRRHAYTPYQSRTQNHSRWVTSPHCMRSCPSCLRACSAVGSSSSVRRKSAAAPLLSPRRLRAMPRLK